MEKRRYSLQAGIRFLLLAASAWSVLIAPVQAEPGKMAGIRVKYVYRDAVYLEAGSSVGLSAGQRLTVRRKGPNREGEEAIADI